MRSLIALIVLFSLLSISAHAQCNRKQIITASRTEFLGADSSLQRAEDELSTVEFDSSNIIITHGTQQEKMAGTITKYDCNWKVPFKDGKTALKASFANDNGDVQTITITITGKDNKIVFLAEIDNRPDRKIRLTADTFEERK